MKKQTTCQSQRFLRLLLSATVAASSLLAFPSQVKAANLAEAMIRLDSMQINEANVDMLVLIKPPVGNVGTEDHIIITFDSSFQVNATNTNILINTTGIDSLSVGGETPTVMPISGTSASAVNGQDVTIALTGGLAADTLYGFYITAGIRTPLAAEQSVHTITTYTSAPAAIDMARVATRTLADADNDEIVISAVVPPSFAFDLSAHTDAFTSDLDIAAVVSTTGVDATLTTNARNGWVAWVKSLNAGLLSPTTTETLTTAGSVDGACETIDVDPAGQTDYYQLDVNQVSEHADGTGTTITITGEYDCANDGSTGGTVSTSFQPIAYNDGTTGGDVIKLLLRASPKAIRAAATDYADTLTVIGAANF